jgi:hypothetical protein
MNGGISSIGENHKTSTILAIAILAAVTVLIISISENAHNSFAYNIKSTKAFSNSGNNQETYQDCGNPCVVSSSNVISRGSVVPTVGITSPTLPMIPAVPTLTVSGNYSNGIVTVAGRLYDEGRNLALAGQTLTVTIDYIPQDTKQSTTDTQTTMTDSNGDYVVSFPPITVPPFPGTVITVTAEYGSGLIIGNIVYVEITNANVIPGPF